MYKLPMRFWIIVMIFLSTYTNYAVRVNMSLSIISMISGRKEKSSECTIMENKNSNVTSATNDLPDYGPRYDWDEFVQALILGSYFWSYAIFSLPSGPVAEWWGPVKIIFWTTIVSLVFNSLCVPAAWLHYGALFMCRFVLGAMSSFMYPALQVLIAKWAPPLERGKFISGLMGNTLATCTTWPLLGIITVHWGWKWGFHFLSLELLIFAVIFYFVVTDNPRDHKYISPDELAYIEYSQGKMVSSVRGSTPYKQLLLNGPFWVLTFLQFGNMWGLYVQLQIVPKLLTEVMGLDLKNSGLLGAAPHLTRLFFALAFGFLGDFLKKHNHLSTGKIRKIFTVPSHILPGIFLVSMCLAGCNWKPVIVLLTFSMAFTGAAVLTNLVNAHDLSPNFAGTIFGISSAVGSIPGFLVPSLNAAFITDYFGTKEWCYTAIVGASIYILTGITFILFGSAEEQSWNRINYEERLETD